MSDQLNLFSDLLPDGEAELFERSATPDPTTLFGDAPVAEFAIPRQIGKTAFFEAAKSQALSPASGFMGDYDYTLNPYMGCQFGCAYCYAAFFINSSERRDTWGQWVDVKTNTLRELGKKKALLGKKIYMSSVTDPYQPIENKIELTRAVLELLSDKTKQPRLVIQTRSPLVSRDIDLFKRFEHLRVNMTVTTDSEEVRKRFEPSCPSNDRRMEAIEQIKAAGIRVCVCITPMLPVQDPVAFARRLLAINADIYVTQPFKPSQGRFSASTREIALDIVREYAWTESDYRRAFAEMARILPHLYEGREGFMPE